MKNVKTTALEPVSSPRAFLSILPLLREEVFVQVRSDFYLLHDLSLRGWRSGTPVALPPPLSSLLWLSRS